MPETRSGSPGVSIRREVTSRRGSCPRRMRAERLSYGAAGELTETETWVAELAAASETNREIADRLFISVKTAEANLSRVYRKLGVRSRTERSRRFSGREHPYGRAADPPVRSRAGSLRVSRAGRCAGCA
jgi:DNA-binding CsgD family transcriptional regulator